MLYEINRASNPYNDYQTTKPCPQARMRVLDNCRAVWCVEVDDMSGIMALCGDHPVIVNSRADNAPFVDGIITIYDDYIE